MIKKPYYKRLMIAIDQFLNVLILNGHEDNTISGHVGWKSRNSDKKRWQIYEKMINKLFWWDKNHCYNSIEWDLYK